MPTARLESHTIRRRGQPIGLHKSPQSVFQALTWLALKSNRDLKGWLDSGYTHVSVIPEISMQN